MEVAIAIVVLRMVRKARVATCVVLARTVPLLVGIDELLSVGNMFEKFIVLASRFVHEDRVRRWLRLWIAITASLVTLIN